MSIDLNIFDCLLDPTEIYEFYQKIGVVLKNDRDIVNERIRGHALHNTLLLLEQTDMIQQYDDGYKKNIECRSIEAFYAELITRIKDKYTDEVAIIINSNKHFDEVKSRFFIYVNDIPLKYMGLAMLMEQTGDFERIKNRVYLLDINDYHDVLKKKVLISFDDLQKKLRLNVEHGERAERFVFEFETSRLKKMGINKEPLSISNVDVMAGYDLVSYESMSSEGFDRFIEVKAISNDGFFWSKNEHETAKDKAEQYYLYLVDLKKIEEPGYCPEMIRNPAMSIMEAEGWFVEAQSYRIKRI